jgi:hypothetical protein
MTSVLRSLVLTFRTAAWSRAALQLEILALRHQLEVLQRTRPRRVRLAKMDRWLWVLLARLWGAQNRSSRGPRVLAQQSTEPITTVDSSAGV